MQLQYQQTMIFGFILVRICQVALLHLRYNTKHLVLGELFRNLLLFFFFYNKQMALISLLTSSVSAASITTTARVATAWSVTIVIPLVATPAAATETTLPVVKAFFRGWACLAALLVVLLQQTFGLLALQLDVRHGLEEVANLRESKVGFESDRGDHGRGRERQSIQQESDGKRKRKEGWGL